MQHLVPTSFIEFCHRDENTLEFRYIEIDISSRAKTCVACERRLKRQPEIRLCLQAKTWAIIRLFCLHSTTNKNARFKPNKFILGGPGENQPEPHTFTYTILQSLLTGKTHSNTVKTLVTEHIYSQFSLTILNLIEWLALHIVATTSTRQGDWAPVRRNLQPTFPSKLSALVPVSAS